MTPGVISVLTTGLSCGAEVKNKSGAMLTAWLFTLYVEDALPETTPITHISGGGSYWSGPKPVDQNHKQPQYLVKKTGVKIKTPVTIKVNIGKIVKERTYLLDIDKANITIRVFNIIHNISIGISPAVKNLKRKIRKFSDRDK